MLRIHTYILFLLCKFGHSTTQKQVVHGQQCSRKSGIDIEKSISFLCNYFLLIFKFKPQVTNMDQADLTTALRLFFSFIQKDCFPVFLIFKIIIHICLHITGTFKFQKKVLASFTNLFLRSNFLMYNHSINIFLCNKQQ